MARLKRGRGATLAMQNWYIVQRRRGDLGDGVNSGDNGGTPTVATYGPNYIEPRDIPEGALLDENGDPILDGDGNFILV